MNKGKSKYQKIGNSMGVYVPADVAKDSTFPFHEDDELDVEIIGNKLVIIKTPDLTNNKKIGEYIGTQH